MYSLVRPWRLAAKPLEKVIDPPRSFEPLVTKCSLACMSTFRRSVVPEFTNLCATQAGTTTTWPPVASITSSPAVNVTLLSCTTKTSS